MYTNHGLGPCFTNQGLAESMFYKTWTQSMFFESSSCYSSPVQSMFNLQHAPRQFVNLKTILPRVG